MHLEAVLHTGVYRARPDVGAVVHGHPPYATALGATRRDARAAHTRWPCSSPTGCRVFDETAELITDAEQGGRSRAALGDRTRGRDAQPRRARRRQGRALGGARRRPRSSARSRLQSIASTLGDAAADRARELARQLSAGQVPRRARRRVLGRPGSAGCERSSARHGAGLVMEIAFTLNGRAVRARRRARGAAARLPARPARADRREALVRRPGLRRVHGAASTACPVSSCCFLAADADGREVLTIEGLAERPEFERLEEAFTAPRGPPVRLLHAGHAAHRQRLLERGDLRRRGGDHSATSPATSAAAPGYQAILEAVAELAGTSRMTTSLGGRAAADAGRPLVPRRDAREKLRGQAQFVGDMRRAAHAARQGAAQPGRARPDRLDRHRGGRDDAAASSAS